MWINYANQIFEQPFAKMFCLQLILVRKLLSRHFFLIIGYLLCLILNHKWTTCHKIGFKFHYKGNSIIYKLFNSHLGQWLLIFPKAHTLVKMAHHFQTKWAQGPVLSNSRQISGSVFYASLPFALGTLDVYYLSEKLRFVPLSEYTDHWVTL
jgi:hypothetical protein